MVGKLARTILLLGAICGLCASAAANTTAPELPSPDAMNGMAAASGARIALLLPLSSAALGQAAEAVRDGFLAAHARDPQATTVTVIDTGEAPQDALSGYAAAAEQNDILVGPLSRTDVTAIALSRAISKPTIALTQPDLSTELEGSLPRQLLIIGLSAEDEARQVANWAATGKKSQRALVIATSTPWQRRAGKAFSAQWQQRGLAAHTVELTSSNGVFSASSLNGLKKRLLSDPPDLLFLSLDALQARQIRAMVDSNLPLYGLSQLNPFVAQRGEPADRFPDMDGVRLVDMPWQIQPDHPAVMRYARADLTAEQSRSADLERLYGLGIDACQIALEIAAKHRSFDIDGVSGKLTVRFGAGAASFQRVLLPAVFQDGLVAPLPSNAE